MHEPVSSDQTLLLVSSHGWVREEGHSRQVQELRLFEKLGVISVVVIRLTWQLFDVTINCFGGQGLDLYRSPFRPIGGRERGNLLRGIDDLCTVRGEVDRSTLDWERAELNSLVAVLGADVKVERLKDYSEGKGISRQKGWTSFLQSFQRRARGTRSFRLRAGRRLKAYF